MFDLTHGLAKAIVDSENYKLLAKEGILYLFPADADFAHLVEYPNSQIWEQWATMIVNGNGNVTKNRFGPISAIMR